MIKKTIILLFGLLSITLVAQTIIRDTDPSGVWTVENSPYLIYNDAEVAESDSLYIESGVEVIFHGYYKFLIKGCLVAIGTNEFPITFTVNDTTGFSNPDTTSGSWRGFIFENENPTVTTQSVLSYCDISFAKKIGGYFVNKGGAIYIDYGGSVDIIHNRIHHNIALHGGAVFMHVPTLIINNYITDNYAINYGGGIFTAYNDVVIVNNVIANNRAGMGGGGVRVGGCYNTTFCNNTLAYNLGEDGNAINYSYHYPMNFYNNIIWGDLEDGPQIYVADLDGITNFYNCDIAGGLDNIAGPAGFSFNSEYENNLDIDPNFILSGDDPYALSVDSYCTNSGISDSSNTDFIILENDITGNPRIFQDEIDIGAYELQEEILVCMPPTITPAGGFFNTSQVVEIESSTIDAFIYYTFDGTEPTQNSILYTNPFIISETCIIKAKAFKDTYLESLTTEAVFLFGNTISGEISGTLTLENSPYLITGDLQVLENESLIIEPGVKLNFTGHYSFRVEGNLFAQGTENDSIYFTAIDENIGWNGISIHSTNIQQEVRFDYCVFSYAKSLESNEDLGGAICAIDFPTLTVINCLFEYNLASIGGAIYIENCGGKIDYNIFRNNSSTGAGGAIFSCYLSYADIQNNLFINNFSDGSGGAITYHESQGNLVNNIIKDNYGHYGGGLFIYGDNNLDSPILIGNLICENSSHHMGNAIYIQHFSDVQIINCTIADNYSESTNNPSAIFIYYGCYPTFVNSILWNPRIPEIDIDTGFTSIPMFYNCDVEGGESGININNNGNWFYDCINENPQFIGSGEFPYALSDDSRIINFGTPDTTGLNLPEFDLAGNPRVYGGRIDMGVYENQNVIVSSEEYLIHQVTQLYQNYPNPFNPKTTISFSLQNNCNVELSIYNIKGQKVKQLIRNHVSAGQHSVVWDGRDENNQPVSSGIYLYRIKTDDFLSKTKKMLLLK